MRKPTQMQAFDALYQIAAADGRGEALFGDSVEIARVVYERTLVGSGYPHAYLEFPLLGEPCFDILSVHAEVKRGAKFAPGAGFGRQAMLDWFAGVCGNESVSCGIELDTSIGENERAGVYLQFRDRIELIAPFLDSIGESARLKGYMSIFERMPEAWPPAYVGLFPGRPGTPLRIGGYLGQQAKDACTADPAFLGKQFEQIGFSAYDDNMLTRCAEFMALAPGVDFQFDIMEDGGLGDTFGLSLSFNETKPRQAFSRSLIGKEFPTIWFEVPLAGAPRFDLHVTASRTALRPDAEFAPSAGSGYKSLFRWYAEEESGGAGLAFAYDVSEGRIDAPAVHVNVNNAPLSNMDRFFELAARGDAAERYRAFEARLSKGWRVWYAGFHPGRPNTPVRVDCFVCGELKMAYSSVPSLFEQHLYECGFTATSAALRNLAGLVTTSPFELELQFDMLLDGSIGSTIGVSAGFGSIPASELHAMFANGGNAAALLKQLEQRDLADERWRLIADTSFAKLVKTSDGPLALYNMPTFVKIRLRGGEPLDAKAYLQSSARRI